jgi:hypothetical protein
MPQWKDTALKSIIKYEGYSNCNKLVFHTCYPNTLFIFIYMYIFLLKWINPKHSCKCSYCYIVITNIYENLLTQFEMREKNQYINSWENLQLFLSFMPTIGIRIQICQYENICQIKSTIYHWINLSQQFLYGPTHIYIGAS